MTLRYALDTKLYRLSSGFAALSDIDSGDKFCFLDSNGHVINDHLSRKARVVSWTGRMYLFTAHKPEGSKKCAPKKLVSGDTPCFVNFGGSSLTLSAYFTYEYEYVNNTLVEFEVEDDLIPLTKIKDGVMF